MKKTLVLLHSLSNVIALTYELVREMAPDIEVSHLLDETIWYELKKEGKLNADIVRRVCFYAVVAQEADARAMLTTCSSLSPCFEVAQHLVDIPLIRLDLPAIERALSIGPNVGLVATARSTVQPYIDLVGKVANEKGIEANPIDLFCDNALSALKNGEIEKHDTMVFDTIYNGTKKHRLDVIVLCQASLHRVLPQLEGKFDIPVLSALPLAIESALDRLVG
jgi:Asp/Glu/hydantoin racemase